MLYAMIKIIFTYNIIYYVQYAYAQCYLLHTMLYAIYDVICYPRIIYYLKVLFNM